MKQKEVFTHGEGDQWFLRNQSTLNPDHDEYVALLSSLEINPTNVVEIGCSNGYHLEAIRQSFNCRVSGIDPSSQAIAEGNKMFPLLDLEVATATLYHIAMPNLTWSYWAFVYIFVIERTYFPLLKRSTECSRMGGSS